MCFKNIFEFPAILIYGCCEAFLIWSYNKRGMKFWNFLGWVGFSSFDKLVHWYSWNLWIFNISKLATIFAEVYGESRVSRGFECKGVIILKELQIKLILKKWFVSCCKMVSWLRQTCLDEDLWLRSLIHIGSLKQRHNSQFKHCDCTST